MHGALWWLCVILLYFVLGGILSGVAYCHGSPFARKVLNSYQVWDVYRLVWWTLLAFVACGMPTFLALVVFTIVEWIIDAACGGSWAWCGRPQRCGPNGGRWGGVGRGGGDFNDGQAWSNGWGGSIFWARLFYDFVVGLVGIAIGAAFLPLCYLGDGVYGAEEGWGLLFWLGAGLFAVIGLALYFFVARRVATSQLSRNILTDHRTVTIIQLGFILILAVLSGAPIYIYFAMVLIFIIVVFLLSWCWDDLRENWWQVAELFVYGGILFLIGTEIIRPQLARNLYAIEQF